MRTRYILTGVIVILMGLGLLAYFCEIQLGIKADTALFKQAEMPYIVPPMERNYTNEHFRFSLALPQGFSATQLPFDGEGTPVVLQDVDGNGIQIYVKEVDGDPRNLTEEHVRASIPDMQVTEAQAVEIGENNIGVAFLSDNEAYGGASREVWFYFGDKLYQISTYAHLDNLLQAMFSSWQFY